MDKPVKHSVALALTRGPKVLVVLRPNDPGEELPGVWGLPAASQRGQESVEEIISRIAREKLGMESVRLGSFLARGRQERPSYVLDMGIYRVSTTESPRLPARHTMLRVHQGDSSAAVADAAITYYLDWQWAHPEVLIPAANQGSLCAQLFLESLGRWQRRVS